jgi:hypothetical protein
MGGGVGDFLAVQSFTSDNAARYGVRYVYDLAFFMLVKMAFLNIIFGIIIDTFADLRDKRNTIEEDMKNVCFICGIERDEVTIINHINSLTNLPMASRTISNAIIISGTICTTSTISVSLMIQNTMESKAT